MELCLELIDVIWIPGWGIAQHGGVSAVRSTPLGRPPASVWGHARLFKVSPGMPAQCCIQLCVCVCVHTCAHLLPVALYGLEVRLYLL